MMRLYRQHDLDLIYLYKHPDFSLQSAVKSAIAAISNNKQTPFIEIPPNEPQSNLTLPKQVQFHVYLSEKDDADMIKWILNITKGYRNSVLKNLIRHYVSQPALTPFLINTSLLFQQRTSNEDTKKTPNKQPKEETNALDIANEVLHTPINDNPVSKDVKYQEADEVLKKRSDEQDTGESAIDMFDALFSSFDNS